MARYKFYIVLYCIAGSIERIPVNLHQQPRIVVTLNFTSENMKFKKN